MSEFLELSHQRKISSLFDLEHQDDIFAKQQ